MIQKDKFIGFLKRLDVDDSLFEAIMNGYNTVYESEQSIPQYLYHATYRKALKSIKSNNLGASSAKKKWAWDNNEKHLDHVYLHEDPDSAYSYAESSDNVPESWLDEIVLLQIPISALDLSKLKSDPNLIDAEGSYIYYGSIPNADITIMESINSWNPNVSPITPYTNPVGEPMGDYKNIMKQLPSQVGALGAGGSSAGGNGTYKYEPSLANPTRNIGEETKEQWEDAPHFPKYTKRSDQTTRRLMKKAQEHMPIAAMTTPDQIAYYTNMDHMGMYDMDYTKAGASVPSPGP